jgi:site-specific recombinase XerC
MTKEKLDLLQLLRRAELAALKKEDIQIRQGHWAIVDLVGKGNHVRTVPMPVWVKCAVDRWSTAATVTSGPIFRAVSRHGTPLGNRYFRERSLVRGPSLTNAFERPTGTRVRLTVVRSGAVRIVSCLLQHVL